MWAATVGWWPGFTFAVITICAMGGLLLTWTIEDPKESESMSLDAALQLPEGSPKHGAAEEVYTPPVLGVGEGNVSIA